MKTGQWILESMGYQKNKSKVNIWWMVGLVALWLLCFVLMATMSYAQDYTNAEIADTIYLAEGGAKTNHPYGILTRYHSTSPRQACLNTIVHARRDWDGTGDFIVFLGSRYCPVGAENDPTGLNKNWVKNVNYFLRSK